MVVLTEASAIQLPKLKNLNITKNGVTISSTLVNVFNRSNKFYTNYRQINIFYDIIYFLQLSYE